MSDPISPVFTVIFICLTINIGMSLYGIFVRPSLVKKFIALTIFSDTLNCFAVAIGFRRVLDTYPSVAVLATLPESPEQLSQLASAAVDPLPQALVLTAVVIGLAVYMFLTGLIIMYYRYYRTTRVDVVRGGKFG
jgi:multicomponent Na+:H+ antiporter subunit C